MLEYKDFTIKIERTWNVKTKVITSNNKGEWDYFKVIQKIRELHSGKM